VPCGHMRSPGEPQGVFALESHIDEVAARLGLEPVEFRLRNVIMEGEANPLGHIYKAIRAKETLLAAAEASGLNSAPKPNTGRGVALFERAQVGGQTTVRITLKPDGSVTVNTAVFDQGTGTYAIIDQVVAEELCIDAGDVRFEYWGTRDTSFDSGVGGMRASRVSSIAAHEAAQKTRAQLIHTAGEAFGWPEEAVVFRDGEIRRTDTGEGIAWRDLLKQTGKTVAAEGQSDEKGRAETTGFAAQVAEVEVDVETGQVRLTNFTTVHDVGTVVNPVGHQGQINGGFAQGLGYALMEELRIEDGRIITLSFGDYKIPTAADLPSLKTVLLPAQIGVGPYQVKGIGEMPNTPTAAAIANAVADAVGVRLRVLPITAEKVYRALHDGGGEN
jgi:xanthine dehydrogenase molybdenum-binding subunit